MGLTGFNRQRKRELSKQLGVDAALADKLLAYGYTTPEAVRKADELPFLSEDELNQLKKKSSNSDEEKNEPEEAEDSKPEPEAPASDISDEKQPEEAPVQVETNNELDEKFLSLPDDTVFPSHYGGGNYYLSNGEKVSGKAAAKKAQAELNGE